MTITVSPIHLTEMAGRVFFLWPQMNLRLLSSQTVTIFRFCNHCDISQSLNYLWFGFTLLMRSERSPPATRSWEFKMPFIIANRAEFALHTENVWVLRFCECLKRLSPNNKMRKHFPPNHADPNLPTTRIFYFFLSLPSSTPHPQLSPNSFQPSLKSLQMYTHSG